MSQLGVTEVTVTGDMVYFSACLSLLGASDLVRGVAALSGWRLHKARGFMQPAVSLKYVTRVITWHYKSRE